LPRNVLVLSFMFYVLSKTLSPSVTYCFSQIIKLYNLSLSLYQMFRIQHSAFCLISDI